MKIAVLGAGGFIGGNLTAYLCKNGSDEVFALDKDPSSLERLSRYCPNEPVCIACDAPSGLPDEAFADCDILYQLVSIGSCADSNRDVDADLIGNIELNTAVLDKCVKNGVKRVVFISSAGTVYGMADGPVSETSPTEPINSYGMQKLCVEKLLSVYGRIHSLDYRVVRLANPYGRFQRFDGVAGAVTTFVYRAMTSRMIKIYGDGSIVRDYIHIDDAIRGIVNVASCDGPVKLFNLGSGVGTSLNELVACVGDTLGVAVRTEHVPARGVDVPYNVTDISLYERTFGPLGAAPLREGILLTAEYLRETTGEWTK